MSLSVPLMSKNNDPRSVTDRCGSSVCSLYSAADSLRVFSRTLNYWAYYRDKLPALLLRSLSATAKGRNGRLSVLDMGCGGGDLSIPVFDVLASFFPRLELTAVDPSEANLQDFKLLYQHTRAKFNLKEVRCERFQEFKSAEAFDLVFCSHSLYEVFETDRDGLRSGSQIMMKLWELVKPKGALCVIFASRKSWAYECKQRAYELLGSGDRFFMTSEDFRGLLTSFRGSFSEEVVDTYINVSKFWSEQAGDREECLKWLSYFLRVDCFSLPQETQNQLINLLQSFSLPFASLPEQVKRRSRKYPAACGSPSDHTRVVFHKEGVFLGRRNSGNRSQKRPGVALSSR